MALFSSLLEVARFHDISDYKERHNRFSVKLNNNKRKAEKQRRRERELGNPIIDNDTVRYCPQLPPADSSTDPIKAVDIC